jgi:hypothetical protein
MITTRFNTTKFTKDMNNIVKYSQGFVEGMQRGKTVFLRGLGLQTVEILKEYIDSNARVNPEALHHVYEWYQTGIGSARLFEVNYTVSNLGLSFISDFTQSTSIKAGSTQPFYNKARIMESGSTIRIRPKQADKLAFEVDGEQVFTANQVTVTNPGGSEVAGSFERVFDSFFTQYFTQAFLRSSGMLGFLENPETYKRNLPAGKKAGKSKGIATGYRWIANAGAAN